MSQFDFPRIHFSGNTIINPPTANNNILLPLVLLDPIQIKTLMPPRIYFTEELKLLHINGMLPVPENCLLHTDGNALSYIEIATVNTPAIFKEWAATALGKSQYDTAFHDLYSLVKTERDKKPLAGLIPAHWNYYGGMDFEFVDVTVNSIEVSTGENKNLLYTKGNDDCPQPIAALLNASVDLKFDDGKNAAVMVDTLPTLALYTQIFCDAVRMAKNGETILKGRPCKASLRFLNTARIVNQEGAVAGSGTFYCTIPLHDLYEGIDAPIIHFFNTHKKRNEKLAGIFIRFNLFEVYENTNPKYKPGQMLYNPARSSITGSFSPWYENEMMSITPGRQMIAEKPFTTFKTLSPFVCQHHAHRKSIMLDLIGTIPENLVETETQKKYETYPLGILQLSCLSADQTEKIIAEIPVNETDLPRQKMIDCGGIFEWHYGDSITADEIENGKLLLYAKKPGDTDKVLLMSESEYMAVTDQPGNYINQHNHPEEGYLNDSSVKKDCKVRIFRKGHEVEQPVALTIKELRIKSSASAATVSTFMQADTFQSGQALHFPTHEAANLIYVLYPGNMYDGSDFLIPYMLKTGFFINLRVLPVHSGYAKYLDPQHPEYPTPVPFQLVYQELLSVFDLIYPASSLITPFTEAYFSKGWKFIKHRLSPQLWNSILYMPTSRDMSHDQWLLLCKWAESLE